MWKSICTLTHHLHLTVTRADCCLGLYCRTMYYFSMPPSDVTFGMYDYEILRKFNRSINIYLVIYRHKFVSTWNLRVYSLPLILCVIAFSMLSAFLFFACGLFHVLDYFQFTVRCFLIKRKCSKINYLISFQRIKNGVTASHCLYIRLSSSQIHKLTNDDTRRWCENRVYGLSLGL